MNNYATIKDVETLWRPLSENEKPRAQALIEAVSAELRTRARGVGKDLDKMLNCQPDLVYVARSVTVDVVARMLMTSTDQEPMTQFSQSAGGYVSSGTFLVPGGGLFIKKSELARLGLNRQQIGAIDVY